MANLRPSLLCALALAHALTPGRLPVPVVRLARGLGTAAPPPLHLAAVSGRISARRLRSVPAMAAVAQVSEPLTRPDNATRVQTGRRAAAPSPVAPAADGRGGALVNGQSGGSAQGGAGGRAQVDSVGSEMQSRWDELRSRPLRRYIALNSFMAQAAWRVIRANRTNDDARTEATALWVRDGLLRLGPTMIKLGQVFSTRTDLLHPSYVTALATLQTDVPAVPFDRVRAYVEAELNQSIESVYSTFSKQPLAGASLGQVHLATLNGVAVAVKVQRPDLEQLFDTDFASIRLMARCADIYDQSSRRLSNLLSRIGLGAGQKVGAGRDWMTYCDDAARLLYEEIDYVHEGENAQRFREAMLNTSSKGAVLVPRVFWDATTRRLLTMEFISSVKLTDARALKELQLDEKDLQRKVADTFLVQLLETGVLHCDPHPGNLCAASSPGAKNRLVYYDFGMMESLTDETRAGLRRAVLALFGGPAEPDIEQVDAAAEELMAALTQCGFLSPDADFASVRKVGRYIIRTFKAQRGGQPTEDVTKSVGKELQGLLDSGAITFPSAFTFVARAFASVDGICRSLSPSYTFTDAVDGYVSKLITRDYQEQGARWRQGVRAIACAPLEAPRRLVEAETEVGKLKVAVRRAGERADAARADGAAARVAATRARRVAAASIAINIALVACFAVSALRRLAMV